MTIIVIDPAVAVEPHKISWFRYVPIADVPAYVALGWAPTPGGPLPGLHWPTGDYGFGPRGIPHGFRIEGTKPARVLLMTNGGTFAEFVRETSQTGDSANPSEPSEADLQKLVAAAQRHGLSILGPMPNR